MKHLIFVLFISFEFINFIYSQKCDSRGEKGVKQCYENMLKTLEAKDIPDFFYYYYTEKLDSKPICKAFIDKTKCVGIYNNKDCLNFETFSKVFGIDSEYSNSFLAEDALIQYFCGINLSPVYFLRHFGSCDSALHYYKTCVDEPINEDKCNAINSRIRCFKDIPVIETCYTYHLTDGFANTLLEFEQKFNPDCVIS